MCREIMKKEDDFWAIIERRSQNPLRHPLTS
jgi:hypothetical protein